MRLWLDRRNMKILVRRVAPEGGCMNRVRAADDFEAIRSRLDELRRERQQTRHSAAAPEPSPVEPDAVAHVPTHILRRYLAAARRSPSR
jgi:hypothetical protein